MQRRSSQHSRSGAWTSVPARSGARRRPAAEQTLPLAQAQNVGIAVPAPLDVRGSRRSVRPDVKPNLKDQARTPLCLAIYLGKNLREITPASTPNMIFQLCCLFYTVVEPIRSSKTSKKHQEQIERAIRCSHSSQMIGCLCLRLPVLDDWLPVLAPPALDDWLPVPAPACTR